MLSVVEESRLKISKATESRKKSKLGQFFTPARIARFMSGLFVKTTENSCRLLDAGAGIGSLSAAFLERWISGGFDFKRIEIDAFEIDETLLPYLTETIEEYKRQADVELTIRNDDFIMAAVDSLRGNLFVKALPRYTHAILNPPYKKIRSDSAHRATLRKVGIETVNATGIGTFDTRHVGTDKVVTASYTFSDGTNGGLAENYSLADTYDTADIIEISVRYRPLPPLLVPPDSGPLYTTEPLPTGGTGTGLNFEPEGSSGDIIVIHEGGLE